MLYGSCTRGGGARAGGEEGSYGSWRYVSARIAAGRAQHTVHGVRRGPPAPLPGKGRVGGGRAAGG